MVALATFAKAGYAGDIGLLILAIIYNYFVAMAEEQNKAEKDLVEVIEPIFFEVISLTQSPMIKHIETIAFDFPKLSKSFLKWHAKRHMKYKAKLAFFNTLDSIAEREYEEIEANLGKSVTDVKGSGDVVAEVNIPNLKIHHSEPENKHKENFGINAEHVEKSGEIVAEENIPNLKNQYEVPKNNEHEQIKANFANIEGSDSVVPEPNFVEVPLQSPTIQKIETIAFDLPKISKSFLKKHAKRHRKYKAKLAFYSTLDSIAETEHKENFGIDAEDVENTGEIVVEENIPNLKMQQDEPESNSQMKANLGINIADFEVRDGDVPEAISVPQVQKVKRFADVIRNGSGKFFQRQVNRYRTHRAKVAFTSTLADTDSEELEPNTDLNVADVNTSNFEVQHSEPEEEHSSIRNKCKKWNSFKKRFSRIKKFFKKN
ncbi:hypothetical protein JTE90_028017 [Oedothorax gibbosus]|uniref:Uncharacterized protein n=1 Tax=Oedothorax gibbosus TaxID=931172 RepID=A0AAV6VGE7_9ARAC|nr:hypothetical protein JTE90_028017 [Oedothorax gibbosus]